MKRASFIIILCIALFSFTGQARTASAAPSRDEYTPLGQTTDLFSYEARTVYLTNLERRKAGRPPLRWNRELTLASRWFAWDSVANRPYGWIGHEDSLGGYPGNRALDWGYLGGAGAENAGWASYLLPPEEAVRMWMESSGHRDNLLNPSHQEIGVGYYSLGARGSTYMVQGFGTDPVSPPLIIENEAPSTSTRVVSLYQHSPAGAGSIAGLGKAVEMMVSSSPCFTGAEWQPYQPEISFTLPSGDGWKTVYSKIRDRLGRTLTTSDTIYLGASLPGQTLNLNQLSTRSSTVTLYGLDGGGLDRAQFSLGWVADDSSADFKKWWGNGAPVSSDPAAVGGTAYRMYPGDGETMAWITSYGFLSGSASYVAYFRLKTSSAASGAETARIAVEANGVTTTRSLKGSDFDAANRYQEFAIPFNFSNSASDRWLKLMTWRSGSADIIFDSVTIFTAPAPFTSTMKISAPGQNYRGQGVWVRYSNADSSTFTPHTEAPTASPLTANTGRVTLLAEPGAFSNFAPISVGGQCSSSWNVASAPEWLDSTVSPGLLRVRGIENSTGTFSGSVVLEGGGATVAVPVRLIVVPQVHKVGLPVTILK